VIDIVIVNWNSGPHLRACLESLAQLKNAPSFHVFVVDNASTDDSLKNLADSFPLTILSNSLNRGFAAGCNQGANTGSAPFVLFLNPDTLLDDPKALSLPAERMKADAAERIGICGVQLVDEKGSPVRTSTRFPTPGRLWSWMLGLDRILPGVFQAQFVFENDHRRDFEPDVVMGAFFFVRRSLFEELGGFDERFFVYYEEVDFCRRACSAGHSTQFLAEASVVHKGHGTTEGIKARRYFLVSRSRIIYGFVHFGRGQGILAAMGALVLEPIIRVAFFAALANFRSVGETLAGAFMLWKEFPMLLRAAFAGFAPQTSPA
jgi:N-acetylglucosaminyl-diphospho-decaprenol L-rhamnosyltransferase